VSSPGPDRGPGETLEQGRTSRRPRSRRIRLVVTLVAVGLLLVAVGVDHSERQREGDSVGRCVRDATTAVEYSSARVDGIVSYVHPALDSDIPPALRRRLQHLISISVAPTVPDVRRARGRCLATHVLAIHDGLRATRADCLDLLERDLAYLSEILSDGTRALGWRSLPPRRCTP
jgi:hypothetical protein